MPLWLSASLHNRALARAALCPQFPICATRARVLLDGARLLRADSLFLASLVI